MAVKGKPSSYWSLHYIFVVRKMGNGLSIKKIDFSRKADDTI